MSWLAVKITETKFLSFYKTLDLFLNGLGKKGWLKIKLNQEHDSIDNYTSTESSIKGVILSLDP